MKEFSINTQPIDMMYFFKLCIFTVVFIFTQKYLFKHIFDILRCLFKLCTGTNMGEKLNTDSSKRLCRMQMLLKKIINVPCIMCVI